MNEPAVLDVVDVALIPSSLNHPLNNLGGDPLQPPEMADQLASMGDRKLRLGKIVGGLFSRIVNPKHVLTAIKLHHHRKDGRKRVDDAQLQLYAKTLPGDFLHFGYFDQTNLQPQDMTLNDITRAQDRYADQLLELIVGGPQTILDVGCGMGGLARMLTARGHTITAITPDRSQAAYVQRTLPNVEVIRSRFEQMDPSQYAGRFNTIFSAESLQYLKLDKALPLLKELLAPEGRWIACDFFYNAPSADRSQHCWPEFKERLKQSGWKLTYERDITANVLPTLRYIHMWAHQFGLPLVNFAFHKFERKQPGLHHICLSTLQQIKRFAQSNISIIDPQLFSVEKRYVLMAIERA